MTNEKNLELENYKKLLYFCDNGDINQINIYLNSNNINGILSNEELYINSLPINMAIDARNYIVIEFLLKLGANPNKTVKTGYGFCSPIFLSLYTEIEAYNQEFEEEPRIDAIKLLIKYGANINSISDKMLTPLDLARTIKHYTAEKYLKSLGAKTFNETQN